ncbi:MAG: hypothetical protein P4L79_03825 [Legionella sp.]|uniref:hypothetical protein n=1 Tax=Legionella sp. TaxID=459 RepID=UPI00284432BC|nr:hypothetical protein [Legionella sp.]
MSKSYDELLHSVQFTKLIVNIKNDINKLRQAHAGEHVASNFDDLLNRYLNSGRSLNEYIVFRDEALRIKRRAMHALDNTDTKQIVYNIALGILGLGIVYGLAVGMNYLLTGKALFFKPEAVSRLEAVFDDVDALKHNAFAAIA